MHSGIDFWKGIQYLEMYAGIRLIYEGGKIFSMYIGSVW